MFARLVPVLEGLHQRITLLEAPCKKGETAKSTGCTPANGNGGEPAAGDGDGDEGAAPTSEELEAGAETLSGQLSAAEKSSVSFYVNEGFTDLNAQMRDCPESLDCLSAENKAHAENLQATIDKAGDLPAPVEAFRGVSMSEEQLGELENKVLATVGSGEPISFNGITSMSLQPDIATDFAVEQQEQGIAGAASVLFRIKAKSGAYLGDTLGMAGGGEQELVHGHGQQYRVTGFDSETISGNRVRVISLEQL